MHIFAVAIRIEVYKLAIALLQEAYKQRNKRLRFNKCLPEFAFCSAFAPSFVAVLATVVQKYTKNINIRMSFPGIFRETM